MFVIIETDIYGDLPENEEDRCYLNHAYLASFSFGSLDMAWNTESKLEAEGTSARMVQARKYRHHDIIEI